MSVPSNSVKDSLNTLPVIGKFKNVPGIAPCLYPQVSSLFFKFCPPATVARSQPPCTYLLI